MTLTGLLRILFRWKNSGLMAFGLLLCVSLLFALTRPLVYESQVILERKPTRIAPPTSQQDEEFDVYRLTSESQWSVALLKSRYLLEQWMNAIGMHPDTPQEKERMLSKLYHSLNVQPVSYTDLFVVKVRAFSPAEAARRAGMLVDTFARWDLDQNRQDTEQLIRLLQQQMEAVRNDITRETARLRAEKSSMTLRLSDGSVTHQTELTLHAKGTLYDNLTGQLEEAQREMHSDRLPRTHELTTPTISGKPVYSRGMLIGLAICLSALLSLGFMFLLEWQDPTVRRMQDITRVLPSYPVLAVPSLHSPENLQQSALYMNLLTNMIGEQVRSKGYALVQFVSPSQGDGKTTLVTSLAQVLATDFQVCLVHQSSVTQASAEIPPQQSTTEKEVRHFQVGLQEPLTRHLPVLKKLYNVFLVDTDSVPNSAPGSNVVEEADMVCMLVSAGRTSRHLFRALRHQLQRLRNQSLFFILNYYTDPLPSWLQSR